MKKWEYLEKTVSLSTGQDWTLEELGEQGWELCSVVYTSFAFTFFTFYFKREKE